MRKKRKYPKDKDGFILLDSNDNPMSFSKFLLEEVYIKAFKKEKIYYLGHILNIVLVYPLLLLYGYVSERS